MTAAVSTRLRVSDTPGVRAREPLAPHTSLGIGGPADLFAEPNGPDELAAVVRAARAEGLAVCVLGGGSNVLFADEGFRGLVVSTRRLDGVRVDPATGTATAGTGARLLEVLAACRRAGVSGFEFADGIPGTVGGALVTNAGTALGEISSVLESVHVLDARGDVTEVPAQRLALGYRRSDLAALGWIALSARFALRPGVADDSERAGFAQYRKSTQPAGLRNAGSIFKNPPGGSAGAAIDRAGLKGARAGGAVIAEAHANFIVNTGGARASDVIALMVRARDEVRRREGLTLEPEIVLMGSSGPVELPR